MKKVFLLILSMILLLGASQSFSQIKSAATGLWSAPATWVGGVVPSSTDDVSVEAGHSVTNDVASSTIKNLNVDGTLYFSNDGQKSLTITGNVTIGAAGNFQIMTGTLTTLLIHNITIYGNLTVTLGGKIDMRRGSNPTPGIGEITFAGNTNSEISLSKSTYGSSTEEFNGITINKTGGAKVILKTGVLFMSNNTSTAPTILTFVSGGIEVVAPSVWGYTTTNGSGIVGGSNTMYVKGILGRGMSNSDAALRVFPVGDANGYRPVTVKSTVPQLESNPMVQVQSILGNANHSSTLVGSIDKVSSVRYFEVMYNRYGKGATTLSIDTLGISYGSGDGVAAGNTNLRIAYSLDTMKTWTDLGPVTHTTSLSTTPTTIIAGPISPTITLNDGKPIYLALARKTGTTENTLVGTGSAVEKEEGIPTQFNLSQNYPNPFNPTTNIKFDIMQSGFTSLIVYDLLGREVSTILKENLNAGSYRVEFNASNLSSGIYIYRLNNANVSLSRKMLFIK